MDKTPGNDDEAEKSESVELFKEYTDYYAQLAMLNAQQSNFFIQARFNPYAALFACDVMRERLARLRPLKKYRKDCDELLAEITGKDDEKTKAHTDGIEDEVRVEIRRVEEEIYKHKMTYGYKRPEFSHKLLGKMKILSDKILDIQQEAKLYLKVSQGVDFDRARVRTGTGR